MLMLGLTVEHWLLRAESQRDLVVWTMNVIILKKYAVGNANYVYATDCVTKHLLAST